MASYANFVDLFTTDFTPTETATVSAEESMAILEIFGPRPAPRAEPGESPHAGRFRVAEWEARVANFENVVPLDPFLEDKLLELSAVYDLGEFVAWRHKTRGVRVTWVDLVGKPTRGAAVSRVSGSQLIVFRLFSDAIMAGQAFDPEVVTALRLPDKLVQRNNENWEKAASLVDTALQPVP